MLKSFQQRLLPFFACAVLGSVTVPASAAPGTDTVEAIDPAVMTHFKEMSAIKEKEEEKKNDTVWGESVIRYYQEDICQPQLDAVIGKKCLRPRGDPLFQFEFGWPGAGNWSLRSGLDIPNFRQTGFGNAADIGFRIHEINIGFTPNDGNTHFRFGILPPHGFYTPGHARPFNQQPTLLDETFNVLSVYDLVGGLLVHQNRFGKKDKWGFQTQISAGRKYPKISQIYRQGTPEYAWVVTNDFGYDLGFSRKPVVTGMFGFTRFTRNGGFSFGFTGSFQPVDDKQRPIDHEITPKQIRNLLDVERGEAVRTIQNDGGEFIAAFLDNSDNILTVLESEDLLGILKKEFPDEAALLGLAQENPDLLINFVNQDGNKDKIVQAFTSEENAGTIVDYIVDNAEELLGFAQETPELEQALLNQIPLFKKNLADQYHVGAYMHWHYNAPIKSVQYKFNLDMMLETAYIWNLAGDKNINAPVGLFYLQMEQLFRTKKGQPVLGVHVESGVNVDPRLFVAVTVGGGIHVPLTPAKLEWLNISAYGAGAYQRYPIGVITENGGSWRAGMEFRFHFSGDSKKKKELSQRRSLQGVSL